MANNFTLDDILDEYSDKAKSTSKVSDEDVDELIGSFNTKTEVPDENADQKIIDDSIFNEVIDDGRQSVDSKIVDATYKDMGIDEKTSPKETSVEDIDVSELVSESIDGAEEIEEIEEDSIDEFSVPDIDDEAVVDGDEIEESLDIKLDNTTNTAKTTSAVATDVTEEIDMHSPIEHKKGLLENVKEKISTKKEIEEEIEEEGYNDGAQSRFRLRKTSGNTAIIEGLMKLKRERGAGTPKEQNVTPVKRLKIKDVDLHIEDKIIPQTEQFDKINIDDYDLPDDMSDTMKLRILQERRKNKVSDFKLEAESKAQEKAKSDVKDREAQKYVKDFKDYKEASSVLDDILQLKSNLVIRLCILLFTSILSGYIAFANDYGWPIIETFKRTNAESYIFANLIIGLIAAFVSYTVIFAGFKKLIKLQADGDSIVALAMVVNLVASVFGFMSPSMIQTTNYNIYLSVAIIGLLFNTLGKLLIVKRTERNFKYVAGEYDKYAVTNVVNEDIAAKFTKGSLNDFPELATMKRTGFNNEFLGHSYSADIADKFSRKFSPLLLIAAGVIAILAIIFDRNASGLFERIVAAIITFSGAVSLASCFSLLLVVNLPLEGASKKFLQSSGVMLGYSAIEEFADTNSLLVDAKQLFPEGMISLVNIKAMSTTSIEECILISASLCCQAGSVLQPMFYGMLRGKTEMLYPVESYIYEDSLGLSGWIENQRVLFGTRELMENHSIEGLPSKAKEAEYSKGYVPMYLSISGVVSTLFVLQINPSISVKKWLGQLESQEITTVIRSVDGFISLNLLSEIFDISPDSIKLLPFRYHKEYEEQTEYKEKTSSPMLCSGHFPSLAILISGAKKLSFIMNIGTIIQFATASFGLLLAFIMLLVGTFSSLTASIVILLNLLWVLITIIAQQIKRP